jgi:hypothetical protein
MELVCCVEKSLKKSSSKMMATVFSYNDAISPVDCLVEGATIPVALVDRLKQQRASKPPGKLSKGIFFNPDNVALHKAAIRYQQLADLHAAGLKHSTYSFVLVPFDYRILHNLKEQLEGRTFWSIEETTLAAGMWINAQLKQLLLDGARGLQQRSHQCQGLSGGDKERMHCFSTVACRFLPKPKDKSCPL